MSAMAILFRPNSTQLRQPPNFDFHGNNSPARTKPEAKPIEKKDQLSTGHAQYYNLKFDFFYEKVHYASQKAQFLAGDRARSISQKLYQRVTARFSLDLSFLSVLADRTGRAAAIDPEIYNQFVAAAQGLTDLDQESLKQFLGAVDGLFNAVEQTLGLASDGLDPFAETVKGAVKQFFADIQSATKAFIDQDRQAAKQFQNHLQSLLEPPKEANDELNRLRQTLIDAGVNQKQQNALLKLASLVLQLSKRHPGRDKPALIDQLSEFAKRFMNRAKDEMQAMPAHSPEKVLKIYKESETKEQTSVQVQQSQVDLVAG